MFATNLTLPSAFFPVSAARAATLATLLTDFNAVIGNVTTTTETFDNGTTCTLSGGDLGFAGSEDRVSIGRVQSVADRNGTSGALLLTWDFGAPGAGFGTDFGSGFGGASTNSSNVEVSIDGVSLVLDLTTRLGGSGGFLGSLDTAAPCQTVLF
ncbi:MAG: hypothetical protein AAGG09_01035 [Pseudomonadota bacterium]